MNKRNYTSLRVPASTHNKIKSLASMKGMKITEYLDKFSDTELENVGLCKLKDEKRKKYVFKI